MELYNAFQTHTDRSDNTGNTQWSHRRERRNRVDPFHRPVRQCYCDSGLNKYKSDSAIHKTLLHILCFQLYGHQKHVVPPGEMEVSGMTALLVMSSLAAAHHCPLLSAWSHYNTQPCYLMLQQGLLVTSLRNFLIL